MTNTETSNTTRNTICGLASLMIWSLIFNACAHQVQSASEAEHEPAAVSNAATEEFEATDVKTTELESDAESIGDGFCLDDIYGSYLRDQFLKQQGISKRLPKRNAKGQAEAEAIFAAREVLLGPTPPYFGGIPVVANGHVERWINHFKDNGRPTFMKWLARSHAYRDLVVPLLIKEGLPPEFFFMAMIESGFSNTAASSKRATGTWQFMKGTAKLYDLTIDHWVDERRDPVKSTIAAARYLRDLYGIFGDWYLAMAAYNAGPGKIKRAIKSAGTHDFWELVKTPYIRPETKNYVPKMLAALNLSMNAKFHGFDVDLNKDHILPLSNVTINRPIAIDELAIQLDLAPQQLRTWNPELVREITPPRKNQVYQLRLAQDLLEKFENLRERLSFVEVTDILMHQISHGDTLSSIARKYRVSVSKIRELNPQLNPSALRLGREIAIPIPGIVSKSPATISSLKKHDLT